MMRCPIISGTVASLLFGKRQELRRKLAHRVAVERDTIRHPEAVEN